VKRKFIIGMTLALVVAVILAFMIWPVEERPGMGIIYERISLDDPGKVWFSVTNMVTNKVSFLILEEQQSNGVWKITDGRQMPLMPLRLTGQQSERLPYAVPSTTNVWRLVVHYFPLPDDSFAMRTRRKLMTLGVQHPWTRLDRLMSPVKLRRSYGPEMLGNKPVEKK
jgi:hypothetical protein